MTNDFIFLGGLPFHCHFRPCEVGNTFGQFEEHMYIVFTKSSKGKRSDTQINKSNFDKESTSKVAFNYMASVVVPLLHF